MRSVNDLVGTPSTVADSPQQLRDVSFRKYIDSSIVEIPGPFATPGSLKQAKQGYLVDKVVAVNGCCFGTGQDKEGVRETPLTLRRGGLEEIVRSIGYDFVDMGDFHDGTSLEGGAVDESTGEDIVLCDGVVIPKCESSKFVRHEEYYQQGCDIKDSTAVGNASFKLFKRTAAAALRKQFVLNLGGDHSTAFGSIAGMMKAIPDICVIWVDAHADANIPETSPSKYYHGMPAAHLMGWFRKEAPGFEWIHHYLPKPLDESSLSYIGLRDLDEEEKDLLRASKTNVFTMQHIDRFGIHAVVASAIKLMDPAGTRPIHISLDIDSCDPSVAPGTGTKARGGLTYREIHYVIETIASTGRLVSMDLVEINPVLDVAEPAGGLHGDLKVLKQKTVITQTVKLGLELVNSALCGLIL